MTACQLPAHIQTEAIGWVALFRLTLWVLPFRYSLALAKRLARGRRAGHAAVTGADLEAALRDVGRFVPRATCLPRALGAAVTLARGGEEPDLLLGTPAGARGGSFSSHAWIELDRQPVFGEAVARHQEIARLPLRLGD